MSPDYWQHAIMRGRQDKESYWKHVMRLKIYTEKSLGREESKALALVLPSFARVSLLGFHAAIFSSRFIYGLAQRTKRKRD